MLGFMGTFFIPAVKELQAFAEEMNEFAHLGPGQDATSTAGPALGGLGELLWGSAGCMRGGPHGPRQTAGPWGPRAEPLRSGGREHASLSRGAWR